MTPNALAARLALVIWVALAASCGNSPSGPSAAPVSPDAGVSLEGVWRIEYRLTECVGERHCFQFIGQTRRASLRLRRSGSTFDGALTVMGQTVDVSGTIASNGELALTGVKRPVARNDLEVEVRSLRLRTRDGSGGLAGDIEYLLRGNPYGSLVNTRHAAEIVGGERVAEIPTRDLQFTGTWTGSFVVHDCEFIGWAACYPREPNELHPITISLIQDGDRVEGTLSIITPVPVTGRASGDTLQLEGSVTTLVSGGTEAIRLTSWSSRRDVVGRMFGTFDMEFNWFWSAQARRSATTYRLAQLVSVTLTE